MCEIRAEQPWVFNNVQYFFPLSYNSGIATTFLSCSCNSTNKNSVNPSLRSHHFKMVWLVGQFQPSEGRWCKTETAISHTFLSHELLSWGNGQVLCQPALCVVWRPVGIPATSNHAWKNTLNSDASGLQKEMFTFTMLPRAWSVKNRTCVLFKYLHIFFHDY